MALINFARREIEVKIVFYGPAYSGKTTNVEILHRLMPPSQRGELHSLRTEQDRTLFFDYVPVQLGEIAGFTARFKLFTVPGQTFYKETRRVLLAGADAVVFVADSGPDRTEANLESLVDLEDNLRLHGLDLHSIPLVIQLNKRDVAGALDVETMTADLNPFDVPVLEAIASEGRGVLDTLRRITDIAGQRIRENLSGQPTAVQLTAIDRRSAEDDRDVVRDHLNAIRKVRPEEDAAIRHLRASGQLHAHQVDAVLSELVVRSEDVTPPDPIAPPDDAVDELPVPGDAIPVVAPRPGGLQALGRVAAEATPIRRVEPPPAAGHPLDAWVDAPGAHPRAVLGAHVGSDGTLLFEMDAEWDGVVYRHPVSLRLGRPAAPSPAPPPALVAAPPPPEAGALRWAAFGGATFVTAIGGMLLGILLGWFAFTH